MTTAIDEPVAVAARFEGSTITPLAFRWNRRKIPIQTISFRWEIRQGATRLLHFNVVSGGTVYELVFDVGTLTWRLGETTTNDT